MILLACLSTYGCRTASEVYCFQADHRNPKATEAINPLIGILVSCYDEESPCEQHAKAEATRCSAVIPQWHCFSFPSTNRKDPLDGMTFCYPSLQLCDAARTPSHLWMDGDPPKRSECAPAATVYCQASAGLLCAATDAMCNRGAEMVAAAMPSVSPAPSRCVPRRSAR